MVKHFIVSGLHHQRQSEALRTRTAFLLLGIIFGVSAIFLVFVYSSFPDLEEDEAQYVKFPKVYGILTA